MKPNVISVTDDVGNEYSIQCPVQEDRQMWHSDFIAKNGSRVRIGVYFQSFTPAQWEEYESKQRRQVSA